MIKGTEQIFVNPEQKFTESAVTKDEKERRRKKKKKDDDDQKS